MGGGVSAVSICGIAHWKLYSYFIHAKLDLVGKGSDRYEFHPSHDSSVGERLTWSFWSQHFCPVTISKEKKEALFCLRFNQTCPCNSDLTLLLNGIGKGEKNNKMKYESRAYGRRNEEEMAYELYYTVHVWNVGGNGSCCAWPVIWALLRSHLDAC